MFKAQFEKLFKPAGISANGGQPWDIQVHNEGFFRRLFSSGSLGLGESYMDGWWDCAALDEFFARSLAAHIEEKFQHKWPVVTAALFSRLFNWQSKKHAFEVGERHYDTGNDLYQAMLGESLAYTCGYWKEAATLDEAQKAKFDLVCRKLDLKPGMHILDAGCGWGSFLKYAAEKHGVSGVGVTVSKEQVEFGQKLCAGLSIQIRLQDYRDVNEKFDRVVSLGMFEHVGFKNYRTYMQTIRRCLKDDGLFLLHTIGNNFSTTFANPWIHKYIFPNGMLPSIAQIGRSIENLFVMEDWHNFGADYDKTLMAWHRNFQNAWPSLKARYDERFHRMWQYYLLSCAGLFRARRAQLWQIVLSPNGDQGGYKTVR